MSQDLSNPGQPFLSLAFRSQMSPTPMAIGALVWPTFNAIAELLVAREWAKREAVTTTLVIDLRAKLRQSVDLVATAASFWYVYFYAPGSLLAG